MPDTLAATLLAIQQRRGTLFMLDTSRSLIESWDLRCDRLQDQSAQTLQLVENLLNCSSLRTATPVGSGGRAGCPTAAPSPTAAPFASNAPPLRRAKPWR